MDSVIVSPNDSPLPNRTTPRDLSSRKVELRSSLRNKHLLELPTLAVQVSNERDLEDVSPLSMLAAHYFVEQPKVSPELPRYTAPLSAMRQLWEGTVISVDSSTETFEAALSPRYGIEPPVEHMAEIDLAWVSSQDSDLVKPGAVFYLTLCKVQSRGSVRDSQEIRFRRKPYWTAEQIRKLNQAAESLHARLPGIKRIDE